MPGLASTARVGATAVLLFATVGFSTPSPVPPFAAVDQFASPRMAALRDAVARNDLNAVEQFWVDVRRVGAPLVESVPGEAHVSLVTFVYRGSAGTRNVVVADGVAAAVGGVDPRNSQMTRLATTDVWFRSYKVRTDARFVYKVSENDSMQSFVDPIRTSNSTADPLNPRVFATGQSYLELPEAPPQDDVTPGAGPRGLLAKTTFHSTVMANDRDVWIYTPPGHREGGGPYSLLVVLDGAAHTSLVPVSVILDNLLARRRMDPLVAVMVGSPSGQRDVELSCSDRFGAMLSGELVPWMRARYGASSAPERTVIAGSSRGGLAAACAAFQHPDVFGKVLSQSGSYWWTPDVASGSEYATRQLFARSPVRPIRFYLEVGEMEIADQLDTSRRLRDMLVAKGYAVEYHEFNGNHTYLNWRGSFGDGLMSLMSQR